MKSQSVLHVLLFLKYSQEKKVIKIKPELPICCQNVRSSYTPQLLHMLQYTTAAVTDENTFRIGNSS